MRENLLSNLQSQSAGDYTVEASLWRYDHEVLGLQMLPTLRQVYSEGLVMVIYSIYYYLRQQILRPFTTSAPDSCSCRCMYHPPNPRQYSGTAPPGEVVISTQLLALLLYQLATPALFWNSTGGDET